MGRFYGSIGFSITSETKPGVYKQVFAERNYYGEILSNFRRLDSGESINDDVTINNKFSIIADPFANENFHAMRYIVYMGTAWKITNVEVQAPRLIITAGGVYNGKQA